MRKERALKEEVRGTAQQRPGSPWMRAAALSQSVPPAAAADCLSTVHSVRPPAWMPRSSLQERARQEYLATVKGRDEKALSPEIEEIRARLAAGQTVA